MINAPSFRLYVKLLPRWVYIYCSLFAVYPHYFYFYFHCGIALVIFVPSLTIDVLFHL